MAQATRHARYFSRTARRARVDDPDSGRTNQVRVALIGCTGLLGDIIRKALDTDPSITVVAELPPPATGEPLPVATEADLLLWKDADESAVATWMQQHARRPRVLATLADGREASLWELVPRRTALGTLSPATLVQTIHAPEPAAGGAL
jgi:hypothetical protein